MLCGNILPILPITVANAAAGVPEILGHQGRLLDSSGNLLGGSGTEYCFKFAFYDDATVGGGDVKLWPSGSPSTMTVNVISGVYNVGIGDTVAGGDALDFNFQSTDTAFLDIQVATKVGATCAAGDGAESFENLSPRQPIYASGYAINANTVAGFTPAQSATGSQIPVLTSGNLVLGGTNPQLNATGSNALTLQSGATGSLQFFSALNNITSSGALTLASTVTADGLTMNGVSTFNASVTIGNGAGNDKLEFVEEATNPACAAGQYFVWANSADTKFKKCENGSISDLDTTGGTTTLQSAYNGATNPELIVDATRGALTIRDAATPIAANLLEIQNNGGSSTFFAVTTSGINVAAGSSIITNGSGALTIGDANLTALTVTTDGTGNAEVVLPTGSIGSLEILDSTITTDDIADATITGTDVANDSIVLSTDTAGDFVASFTAGAGLTGDASGEGSTPTLAVVSGNGGIVVNANDIALTVAPSANGLSSTTSSGSGLEILASGAAMIQGCADNEILKWDEDTDVWACASDATGSATAWDTIGDPSGNGSIAFAQTAQTLDWDMASDAALSAVTYTLNNDVAGANTQRLLSLTNENNAANTTTEALIFIDNEETAASTVSDGILITSSGVNDGIIDGLDVSDSNLTNAINIGSNNIITGAATISSAELDRLDGKDAALVDTNDAVATAITGTGALNSGSITSGFGAIDTGADNISTTGTVSGNAFDRTSAGVLNFGSINATSLILGGASVTSLTVTTDGTGDAEVVLPTGSIGSLEILDSSVASADIADGTITTDDLAAGAVANADIADDTIDFDKMVDAGALDAAWSVTGTAGETITFVRSLTNNTSENGASINVTASDTGSGTTSQFGLYIDNLASTEALDAGLVIDNSDTDDAVGAAIKIVDAGGGYTSIIDNAGTLISGTELNRLDGKDAALVDTNDAVTTAITGTGTLDSGSITSGFGAIDIGADNISTTGTVSGNNIDRTSAGALAIGNTNATSITLGGASITALTVTTDGTGNAEVVLPNDSIGSAEILDNSVSSTDILDSTIASGDIADGTVSTDDIAADTITGADIANDTLDFADFADALTIDSATTIAFTATGTVDPLSYTLTNNAGGATTQQAFRLINGVSTQTNDVNTEALLVIDNADTNATGSTVVDNAILITNSGAIASGITDAIDASATEIVNALNIGTNNIVTSATTISSAELDRLDGKDAALVDTNDAVATAITGTGALDAGSITSGFGAIDTGADNISTTGTVSGNNIDRTSAGALAIGNTNATSVTICNSAACDTVVIGNNADADTITIGDTLDAFSLASTGLNVTSGGALTGVASIDTIAFSATTVEFAGNGTLDANGTLTLGSGTVTALTVTTDGTGDAEVVLPTGSIGSLEILDNSVTSDDLAAGAVANADLADDTVDFDKMVDAGALDAAWSVTGTAGETITFVRTLTNNTSENGASINVTASDTGSSTTSQFGLYIDNLASTEALDAGLVIDNSDTDDAVGAAIKIVDAGGTFTAIIDNAGTLISGPELNRLDGKDAALVDTNDAVATAITGTGALDAGSITSGFGAIDTGADNISTTGTVSGNNIDRTAAGALAIGATNATSITLGGSSITALTITTDGTGDAEVVLPAGSISGTEILNDTVALTTDTTGDYVASFTAGAGLTGDASGEGSTPTLAVVSGNGGIVANANDITLTVAASANGLSATTSSGSGLEVLASGVALLQGCADNEILKWDEDTDVWTCTADATGSATAWDTIGDPSGNGAIAFGQTVQTMDWDMGSDAALDALTVTLNNDVAGANTQRLLVLTNENNAANTATEALIFLDNEETTASTVTDGLLITSSGVDGGIVDAIDVSASNITNALNIGANNIITGAATIASTELDRLDGKDAALVDTNDAVTTAITGTGALDAGSITSNFGAIDIGADNFTTTGSAIANAFDRSAAGALTFGATNATSITIGSGSNGSLTVTTDGTGDAEVVLPTGSISGTEILNDTVVLTTDTAGDYVASFTAGAGLTGDASGEGSTPTLAVVSGNGGIVANANDITLTVAASANGLSATTSSGSGLEVLASGVALLQGCDNSQILKWDENADVWQCASDATGGVPTLDTVAAATGDGAAQDSNANTVNWNWDFTTAAVDSGLNISESSASTTGGQGQQALVEITTLATSTASPLQVTAGGADVADIFFDLTGSSDFEIRESGTAVLSISDAGDFVLASTGLDISAAGALSNVTTLNTIGVTATAITFAGNGTIDAVGTLTLGSGNVTALTVTTDGTGNAEVVLPDGSIGTSEILDGTVASADIADGTVTTDDLSNGTVANADIADDTIDFDKMVDAGALDAAWSVTGTAGETITFVRALTNNTTENGATINVTASDTGSSTTSQFGLYIDNVASTEGLDAGLVIDNSDADDAVGAAIKIVDAGGGYTSIIDNAGTLISGAELNRLDGKDAALVDTNDAVATAITGTGALDAGSITSNFGAIDTGADNISTTGTVSGNSIDRTAAGALAIGNTNATSVTLCNSAACDTITIGTNADADTITIGDTLDAFSIASTGLNVTTGGALTGVASIDTIAFSATTVEFAGNGTLDANGTLTLGSGTVTALTVSTDGTGNAEVVLPDGAIGTSEILDSTITTDDIAADTITSDDIAADTITGADIANDTLDFADFADALTIDSATTIAFTATGAINPLTYTLTNNAGAGTTQQAFRLINGVTTQTTDVNTEALLVIDNADTDAAGSTVIDNAILITNSGAIASGITDAIDVSATEIVNALNIGSNNIVTGATTISSAELDRLDGKDAALVDTNDAVATAITGTGALDAGSITSGFGAIDTGADNISTTGTVSGNNIDRTSAGALAIGNTNATSVTICNSAACDTVVIGNNADADTITIGDTLDAFSLASTGLNVTLGGALTGVASIDTIAFSATTVEFAGNGTLDANGTLTLGSGTVTALTVTTDGTGDAEVVLPTGSIGSLEILDNSVTSDDLAAGAVANADLADDTVDFDKMVDAGALDAAWSVTGTAGETITFVRALTNNTSENGASINVTASDTGSGTTSQFGLYIDNVASTEGLDANLVLDNSDADDAVGAAIKIVDAGGGYTSIIDNAGTLISGAELNRLDGKDAALVDANDAVATAITGTGALDAGSITANFGTIDTGADNISTTGTVSGNNIDRTSAGALAIGNTNATSVSLCNSAACDTITIGTNADADTITLGDTLDAFSIASTGLNVTTGGALTGVASIDTIAFSATVIEFAGNGTVDANGTLTLGSATVSALTVATDGTGNAEVVLPDGSIGTSEILDGTITTDDLASGAVANADIADDTIDFDKMVDAGALDAAWSVTGTAGETITFVRALTNNTTENGATINVTASDTGAGTTSQFGLYVDNVASTEGLDALLVLDNSDADDVVGAAIKIVDAGGTYTSIIDNAGTLISGAELNLLDGHDAALVDTNDAVATAITGTGALDAGSITSNFGAIDTGADNISTTGTVSGNAIDRTSAGALAIGNTNATSVTLCNSAACDTITIGNNADADSITIGDTLDSFALASTGLNVTSGGALTGVASIDTIAFSATLIEFAGNGTVDATGTLTLGSNTVTALTVTTDGTGNAEVVLPDGAIGTSEILDGTITTDDIASNTITGADIADDTLDFADFADALTIDSETSIAFTATGAATPLTYNFTNDSGSANTQQAFRIINAVSTQTTDVTTEALLLLDNADTSASGSTVVTDGLRITNSGDIAAGITNAINIDDTDITTDLVLQNDETIDNNVNGTVNVTSTTLLVTTAGAANTPGITINNTDSAGDAIMAFQSEGTTQFAAGYNDSMARFVITAGATLDYAIPGIVVDGVNNVGFGATTGNAQMLVTSDETTGVGILLTNSALTTGSSLSTTSTNTAVADTAAGISANILTPTFAQGTAAQTSGQGFAGLRINYNQAPTVAGNTESIAIFQNRVTTNTTDTTVSSGLLIDNADTSATGSTVIANGLLVTVSGAIASGIVDAIDASDSNIDNALNIGSNNIVTGATTISSAELDRLDGKDADLVDTNDAVATAITGTGALDAGSITSGFGAIDTGADNISTTGTVSGNAFDRTSAGALTLGDATATSVSICNSAACDTITIGTNADADTITLGDTLDAFSIASTGLNVSTGGALTGVASIDTIAFSATTVEFAGNGTLDANGTLTLGSGTVTALTVTTDGTGNAEVVLPDGAIGTSEILDGTITTDDLASGAVANADIADDTIDFDKMVDAGALDAAWSVTGTAGETITFVRALTNNTTENGATINVTASDTGSATTSQFGLYVDNVASTEGLDALLVLDNSDADDVVGAAIKIVDAGGTYTSIIDNAGTLISGAELNRLDGKDAALVDTNDAVATAITGTGALDAGSITSGFGAIDTGADNISTTGTVSGNNIDRTSAGALAIGNTNATSVTLCDSAACDTISIGTNADADAINIGDNSDALTVDTAELDISGTTGTVTINDGGDAGAFVVEGTNLDINSLDFVGAGSIGSAAGNALTINSGTTGNLNIGTDNSNETITIGNDGAATKTIVIGSANSTSPVTINSGTGDITLNSTDDITYNATDDHLFTLAAGSEVDLTVAASTVTTGVLDINVDSAVTGGFSAINTGLTINSGAATGDDYFANDIVLTQNDADADSFGIRITSAATANATTGSYEALLTLTNAENTAATVTDALLITTTSGTAGDITDAIDVSAADITNAINVGANIILGTTAAIDFSEFDVSSTTGAVTINDGGDAGAFVVEGTSLDINDLTFVGAGAVSSAAGNLTLTPVGGDLTITQGGAVGTVFSVGSAPTQDLITIDQNAVPLVTDNVDLLFISVKQDTNGGTLDNAAIHIAAESSNPDGGTLNGLQIDDLVDGDGSTTASAIKIGDNWDASIFFNNAAPFIWVADGGQIAFTDPSSNNILRLSDVSRNDNHTLFGDADTGLALSGMTTDLTTGTNEALTISPNGSGDLVITIDDDTNVTLNGTITSTNSQDFLSSTITNQTSSGTQRGIAITNANDAANAVTESLIFLDNAETTASTLTDAILITSSGVNAGVTDAIDASATNITNALNAGANIIAITTGTIGSNAATTLDFAEIDISSTTGSITINDGGNAGSINIESTILDINSLDFTGQGSLTATGGDFDATITSGDFRFLLGDTEGVVLRGSTDSTEDGFATNGLSTATSGVFAMNFGYTVTNASAATVNLTGTFVGGATNGLTNSVIDISTITATNAAGADTVNGINIANFTDAGATITSNALNIGSGFDTNILLNDTTTSIKLANTGALTFEDDAGNDMLLLQDVGSATNHILTGDSDTGLQISGATTDITTPAGEAITINTGTTGDINIGTDSTEELINIGTAGDKTISIGGATGNGLVQISSGSLGGFFSSTATTFTGFQFAMVNTTTDAVLITDSSLTTGNGLDIQTTHTNGSGNALNFEPVFVGGATDALTYNVIDINNFTVTNGAGTDTVNGINIGVLTDPGSTVTSNGLVIGSGWDTGIKLSTPALTQTSASTTSITGINLATAGALVQNTGAGTIDWKGMTLQMPTVTQTTGTVNTTGLEIITSTVATSGSGTQRAINVKDASGNSLFDVKDMATGDNNFGAAATAGAFISTTSMFAEEFMDDVLETAVTADTTAVGDNGTWLADTTSALWTISQGIDRVNGTLRAVSTNTAASGIFFSLGATIGATQKPFLKANVPVAQFKMTMSNVTGTTSDMYIGITDTSAATTTNDTLPANGYYFTNNNSGNWVGQVRSGSSTVGTTSSCGAQTTTATLFRIEVFDTSLVRFLIDTNVTNGISFTDCGTISGTGPTAALGPTMNFIQTDTANDPTIDLDYFRVWQDDQPVTQQEIDLAHEQEAANAYQNFDSRTALVDAITALDAVTEAGGYVDRIDIGRLVAGADIVTPHMTTDRLTANIFDAVDKNLTVALGENGNFVIGATTVSINELGEETETTESVITFDAQGNATFAGSVTAASVTADSITGLEVFTNRIAMLSDEVEGLDAAATDVTREDITALRDMIAVVSADLGSFTTATNESIANVTVTMNNNVTASLAITDALAAELDTLELRVAAIEEASTAKVTSDAELIAGLNARLATLETATADQPVLDLSTFDISGTLTVNGLATLANGLKVDSIGAIGDLIALLSDVNFIGRPYFNNDTAGFATVSEKTRWVDVEFENEYETTPIVNVTMVSDDIEDIDTDTEADAIFGNDIKFVVTARSITGFRILLNQDAPTDISFSWIALAVKNARTTVSTPPVDNVLQPPTTTSEPVVEVVQGEESAPSTEQPATPEPEVVAEPEATPEPEPVPEVAPEPEVVPEATPEPEPTQQEPVQSEPEPQAPAPVEPAQEPAPAPEPTPAPAPEPAPTPSE